MLHLRHNAFEPSFDKSTTYRQHLNVSLQAGAVAYCVADEQQHIVALRSYQYDLSAAPTTALRHLLTHDLIVRQNYRSTKIAWSAELTSLVPQVLFDPTATDAYIQWLLNDTTTAPQVQQVGLPRLAVHVVYQADPELIQLVQGYFLNGLLVPAAAPLLLAAARMAELTQSVVILVHVQSARVAIAAADSRQPVFYNSFDHATATDLLYYTLLAMHQCGLDPDRHPIYLCGDLLNDSEIVRELRRYVRHLRFTEPPAHYHIGPALAGLPTHLFFDLFSLKLCE